MSNDSQQSVAVTEENEISTAAIIAPPELSPSPGVTFCVTEEMGLIQISEQRPEAPEYANMVLLDEDEARALRDWLNKVLR